MLATLAADPGQDRLILAASTAGEDLHPAADKPAGLSTARCCEQPLSTAVPGGGPARVGTGQPGVMPTDLPDECARLLKLQHGVIARWQAAEAGLTLAAIDSLLRQGRWRPLYRGVYATFTGHPPRACLLWAGLLRAGPGAVLSHHSAAELDGLTDQEHKIIHVTVSHDRRVRFYGERPSSLALPLAVHRTNRIDVLRHPARTPPRTRVEHTILDLTQISTSFDDAFSWLCKGCGRRLVTAQQIHAAAGTRARLRWGKEILEALPVISSGVHSNLERNYVRDVELAHGLPTATRQPRVVLRSHGTRAIYLDNEYDPYGVVVELDGRADHLVEDRWRDIHRDNSNARAGKVTLRFSQADVTSRNCDVAADVCGTLRSRGWDGIPCRCGPVCELDSASTDLVRRIRREVSPLSRS